MTVRKVLAGLTMAGMMACPALAQDGQYASQLNRILTEASAGTCSAAYMQAAVLDACNAQIEGMAPALAALGAIESVTFVSAQDTPGGRVETYAVKYAGGETLNWVIGQESEGRFAVVGTGS
jgi:uncharacterized iron-regulated membrane protein